MDNTIKNYIFDFGKVLVHFEPDYMTAACVKDPALAAQIAPVVFDRLYWDPLDWGGITDEALKEACHARLPEALHALADEVYDTWQAHLPFIEGMPQLVRDIKKNGGKLYLLSNVSIGFVKKWHTVPHLAELFSLFDGLVFSGPLGIIKPSREIFRHVMDTYGLKEEDCIFIDDSEKNIRGAENAGIRGYLFDGDVRKLRDTLGIPAEPRPSLDTLCAALTYAMGAEAPAQSAPASPDLTAYVDAALEGRKADRIFMYNPDAIAQWIWEKYPHLLQEVTDATTLEFPLESVMPSVTPVCFGTMYTGAQPEVHGIRSYTKPVITIDTLFDALIRAGKKCVILGDTTCSLGKIFLERDMDYFLFPTVEEINAKAEELILADTYDFIVVYNGNYDSIMHKFGPESPEALAALRANAEAFARFSAMIRRHWNSHDTLVGFAMDHGCHEIDGGCGSHGLDMDEDLHIKHRYQIYPRKEIQ